MSQRNTNTLIVVALVPALGLGLIFSILLLGGEEEDPCAPGGAQAAAMIDPATVPEGPIAGYGHDQLVNAAYIMQAAHQLGLSVRDQTIGVMTAIGESDLVVLDHGDLAGPDSRGLFQQRDNGAWGTYEERMDPFTSATYFFQALSAVKDRDTLEPTLVANRVQRNADPYHYAKYWPAAVEIVQGLSGVQNISAQDAPQTSTQYAYGDVQPQTAVVADRVGPMFGIKTIGGYRPGPDRYDPNGHPAGLALDLMIDDIPDGKATGDRLAKYLQDNAEALGVDYIIWYQRLWLPSRADQGWELMEDRGSITQNHMDHVHVNIKADATIKNTPQECVTSTTAEVNKQGWANPGAGPVTSVYGMRTNPVTGIYRLHAGTDLGAGGCDGPIWAAQTGTVIFSGLDTSGTGIITIDHGGEVQTSYLHMYSSGILVREGQRVDAGQQIGKVGSSGNSTACHLHFEVHVKGSPINPQDFMPTVGITLG